MVRQILALIAVGTLCTGCAEHSVPPPVPVADSLTGAAYPLTLIFSGDVMQHLPQVEAARQPDSLGGGYDYTDCFAAMARFWESADFTVVNLETTLTATGRYSGYPCFASPPALADALRGAGVDVVALANNHICDRGRQGIETTLNYVDSIGLRSVGVYADSAAARRPLMLEQGAYRVALLNYTYGTNGLPTPKGMTVNRIDTLLILQHIRAARADSATHIVAFFHWGEEYQRTPNTQQRTLARWCRDNGIDLAVGSHPHVAQPIDTAGRVVYSLGNLVSNQRDRYQEGGISVRITCYPDKQMDIEYLPHWVYVSAGKKYRVLPAPFQAIPPDLQPRMAGSVADSRRTVGAVREVERW